MPVNQDKKETYNLEKKRKKKKENWAQDPTHTWIHYLLELYRCRENG